MNEEETRPHGVKSMFLDRETVVEGVIWPDSLKVTMLKEPTTVPANSYVWFDTDSNGDPVCRWSQGHPIFELVRKEDAL